MVSRDFIQAHIESFNSHDANTWASHYAENAMLHDPQYPEPRVGRDGIRKDIQDFFDAFADVRFTVKNVIADGQQAAIEGTGAGIHSGPMEGPGGTIAATNRRMEVPFASFIRVGGDGLIEEERRYYDVAGMLAQLGLMGQ